MVFFFGGEVRRDKFLCCRVSGRAVETLRRDCEELFSGTKAKTYDSDNDGFGDGIEVLYGSNPGLPDTLLDIDFDGVGNAAEMRAHSRVDTDDGLVVLASEIGVIDIAPERIVRKGRLRPGKMFLVDTESGRLIEDDEIKDQLAKAVRRDEAGSMAALYGGESALLNAAVKRSLALVVAD